MSIDVIGINSVANLITQSKLNKFIIYRDGSLKGSVPVFENVNSPSTAKARESFIDWANNIMNSNPSNTSVYEIFIFDEKALEDEDEENESEQEGARRRISKRKSNKIRFRFQLASNNFGSMGAMQQQQPQGNYVTREDMATLLNEALVKAEEVKTKNEILQRLERIEEEMSSEDEDEDGEQSGNDTLGRVEKLFDRFETLGKFGSKKTQQPINEPAQVNGVEEQSKATGRDIKANINKAITKLYKFDKDLDLDLLKLAELAEKDNAQFAMFVGALRKM